MQFPGLAEAGIPQKITLYSEKKHNILLWRTPAMLLVWLLHKRLLLSNIPTQQIWTQSPTRKMGNAWTQSLQSIKF